MDLELSSSFGLNYMYMYLPDEKKVKIAIHSHGK